MRQRSISAQVGGLHIHGRGSREAEQVLDEIATAAAFGSDQVETLHRLFVFLVFGLTRRDPPSDQLGVSKNPKERVVYLVRHHRRHLADGSHLFHVQHVIVGAIEFICLLLDAIFERFGPGDDFFVGRAQLEAHAVEGTSQVANFVLGAHFDLVPKFAFGKMFGAILKRFDGLADLSPDE